MNCGDDVVVLVGIPIIIDFRLERIQEVIRFQDSLSLKDQSTLKDIECIAEIPVRHLPDLLQYRIFKDDVWIVGKDDIFL